MAQPLANVIYPGYHLSGQQSQNHESVMLAQLRVQIEFYFSPHNLVNDQYLMSLLQSTEHIGAVPLDVIANFPKVRELHAQAFIGQNMETFSLGSTFSSRCRLTTKNLPGSKLSLSSTLDASMLSR